MRTAVQRRTTPSAPTTSDRVPPVSGAKAESAPRSFGDLERAARLGHHFDEIPAHAPPLASEQTQRPLGCGFAWSKGVLQRNGDKQSKREKTKVKKEYRARRDRKAAGKSAGPLEEVAVSRTKLPYSHDELRNLKDKGKLSPHRIRTVQDTALEEFTDGSRILNSVRDIKSGTAKFPPIKVFRHDKKLYTLDNRRLYAHRRANRPIKYELAEGKAASKDFQRKFSSKDEGQSIRIVPSKASSVPYRPEDLSADSEDEFSNADEPSSHDESSSDEERSFDEASDAERSDDEDFRGYYSKEL